MEEQRDENQDLEYYLEIGAVTIEGIDEDGQIIYAISEEAKNIAPELWEAHIRYVDESLLKLYEQGLLQVEYNENLEAMLHLSKEGFKIAKQMGLIENNMPKPPNN